MASRKIEKYHNKESLLKGGKGGFVVFHLLLASNPPFSRFFCFKKIIGEDMNAK